MFENLNVAELLVLLLVAFLVFGDRLPKVIADGLKMLRNLRQMAQNASGDLSQHLGTDIQLQDLHPKSFVRRHLLSETEEEALRRPLQSLYQDVRTDLDQVRGELSQTTEGIRSARLAGSAGGTTAARTTGAANTATAAGPEPDAVDSAPPRPPTAAIDPEAT